MKNCTNCGHLIPESSKFCGMCGTAKGPIELNCHKCGNTVPDDMFFCDKCGTRINKGSPVPSPSPVSNSNPVSSPASTPTPVSTPTPAAAPTPAPNVVPIPTPPMSTSSFTPTPMQQTPMQQTPMSNFNVQQQQFTPPVQPMSQTRMLIINRDSAFLGLAMSVPVTVNGRQYGSLSSGGSTTIPLDSDDIHVELKCFSVATLRGRFRITGPNPRIGFTFKLKLGISNAKLVFTSMFDVQQI